MAQDESYIFYKERDGKELASVEISSAEFNRIKPAVRKVDEVFRVEELYHMLVTSLLAFDDLIVREADRSRFAEHGSREFGFFRIECNRLAAGFLTVLNMYSEYVSPPQEKSKFGIGKRLFEKESFKFCKGLRNYIQHVGCFPLTGTWSAIGMACDDSLRSVHVTIPTAQLLENPENIQPDTLAILKKMAVKYESIDVAEMFVAVIGFVDEIQTRVRASNYYKDVMSTDVAFLQSLDTQLVKAGYFVYRYGADPVGECRGTVPYMAQKQIDMITVFRERYSCRHKKVKEHLALIPHDVEHRLADADQDIERLVRSDGVIHTEHSSLRRVVLTKYQGAQMRKRYNIDVKAER